MKLVCKTLALAAIALAQAGIADAHFIWLACKPKPPGAEVRVYFGEDLSGDGEYLGMVKGMSLSSVRGEREGMPIKLTHAKASAIGKVASWHRQSVFVAMHDMGVFERGDSKFRLKYYAKCGPVASSRTWQSAKTADDLKLDVVPRMTRDEVALQVLFEAKPVAKAQVIASGPGLDGLEVATDDKGTARIKANRPGRYLIRVRHIEPKAGELNGKRYPETRHYTTLTLNVPKPPGKIASTSIGELPEVITSFGAAIVKGSLYTYGGHNGDAHSYSQEEQSNVLRQFDLKSHKWETLAEGPHLQGLALVGFEDKLVRVGGFTAKNKHGKDHDLWSQAAVAMFHPKTREWSELPPLPEPRSSHDAAVIGSTLFVAGGWNIPGDADKHWHTTAWQLDLSKADAVWKSVPNPPFQRRALALAAHDGKLFVLGGMAMEGGPSRRVDVFDPKAGKWLRGPDLAGDGRMAGFGVSAFATGGTLYATTVDGHLQALSKDGKSWRILGRTPTARFFHRLLPVSNDELLVVGGANMSIGKFEDIEVLNVSKPASE